MTEKKYPVRLEKYLVLTKVNKEKEKEPVRINFHHSCRSYERVFEHATHPGLIVVLSAAELNHNSFLKGKKAWWHFRIHRLDVFKFAEARKTDWHEILGAAHRLVSE